MWIKSLRLEDFQSHKDTLLSLHPHFNTIVGNGNSGKSAIVRALSFVLFGSWEPSWVRHSMSFCRITLTTDNDTEIIREKGTKVNRYVIKVPGEKVQTYENFGTSVPEEVSRILQISKVQIGDKEELNLNVSSQLDNLFLLSNPGSYKAKVLGKLSKAHYLDYVLKDLNREKKRLSVEKTVIEKESEILQKDLEQYGNLEAKKECLNVIGKGLERLSDASQRLEKLQTLFRDVQAWKEAYTQIKMDSDVLEAVVVSNLDGVKTAMERLKNLRELYAKVLRFKSDYETAKNVLLQIDQNRKLLVEKYVSVLQNNKKCPTCFTVLTLETLKKILKETI